jgi:hypothetical protein
MPEENFKKQAKSNNKAPPPFFDENGKKAISRRYISAENGIFALFRLKIRIWTTMPLKVGFMPGFRGLLSDCSWRR